MATTADELLTALRHYATGALKGNTVDTIGAPVDIINEAIIRPIAGARTSSKPIGGSKQLRELFGLTVEDANVAETAGTTASIGGATKAMIVLAARLGEASKTADVLRKGKLSEGTIFQATGTYKEAGGKKAKAVIPDDEAKVTQKFEESQSFRPMLLSEAMTHPDLYRLYPELAKTTISKSAYPEAAFVPRYNHIRIGDNYSGDELRTRILHETQHAVQKADKTQGGGSPSDIAFDLAIPYDQAMKHYLKLPGEQEARFTEYTRDMSKRQIEEEVLKLLRQGKTPSNQ
jgi:hypothetical protein